MLKMELQHTYPDKLQHILSQVSTTGMTACYVVHRTCGTMWTAQRSETMLARWALHSLT